MISYSELISGKTAFEKARTLKPKTVRVDKDTFAVQGASDMYLVDINDAPLFATQINCDCQAGKLKKACYHAASVLIAKLNEDGDKRQAEQQEADAAAGEFDFEFESNELSQPVPSRLEKLICDQAEQIKTLTERLTDLESSLKSLRRRVISEAQFSDYLSDKFSKN